jgi:hypothetical protein
MSSLTRRIQKKGARMGVSNPDDKALLARLGREAKRRPAPLKSKRSRRKVAEVVA